MKFGKKLIFFHFFMIFSKIFRKIFFQKKSIYFQTSNCLRISSFVFFAWIKVQNISKKHNLSISEHIERYKWRNDEIWCQKSAKWANFCIFDAFCCLTRPQSGRDWVVNEVGWGWKLIFRKLQALSFILVKKSSKKT